MGKMKEIFIRNYDKEVIQKGYSQEVSEELLAAEAEYFRKKELAESQQKNSANNTPNNINSSDDKFVDTNSYYGDYPLFI